MIGAAQPITPPSIDLWGIAPIMALVGAGVGVVLLRALLRRHRSGTPACLALAMVGVFTAGGLLFRQWNLVRDDGPLTTFSGMVRVDPFAVFLGVVITAATGLALLLAVSYLKREGLESPEYFALVLLSAAGMLMMTTANNLVVVFLALEVLSIPLYVLAAFDRWHLVNSLKQRERVVIIDPANTYYLSPLLEFQEAKELHAQQATLATLAFLERNPKDFDHLDLLKQVFLKQALAKAQDQRQKEVIEFRSKQLHQKPEIAKIEILGTRDNEVLVHVTGQLVRIGIFQEKAFTEGFPFSLRLKFLRNPKHGHERSFSNGRG